MTPLRVSYVLFLAIAFISLSESGKPLRKKNNSRQVLLKFPYPEVRRDEFVVDDYFGTKVADPYRWLETTNTNEVKDFVDKQNNMTFTYLLDEVKSRSEVRRRLIEIQNAPKFELPVKRGSKYFYFAVDKGVRNFYVQEGRDKPARLLLDPQNFPSPPTYNSISPDGELVAYQLIAPGGQNKRNGPQYNLRIRSVTTNEDFNEVLTVIGFPKLTWTTESRGFFYVKPGTPTRNPEEGGPPPNDKLYYHRIGTAQKDDSLVLPFIENPFLYSSNIVVTDDGNYFMTTPYGVPIEDDDVSFFLSSIQRDDEGGIDTQLNIKPVITESNFTRLEYVTNEGSTFYFVTDCDAPTSRIVSLSLKAPNLKNWTTIVADHPQYHLESADVVNRDKVILRYSNPENPGAGLAKVELRYLVNGSLIREFPIEDGEDLTASGNKYDSEVIFRSRRLVALPEIYTLDVKNPTAEIEILKRTELDNYDPTRFTVTRVNFTGFNDTTRVLYILHPIDLKRTGETPALLVDDDFFDPSGLYLTFLKGFNGIIAVPFLGTPREVLSTSSLTDFVAASEYLIANNYTRPSRLILRRPGPGGMYAAAAVNQRPELFGAVIPEFVDFDLLRYNKYKGRPSVWKSEFGTSEDESNFPIISKISPLHNIKVPENPTVQYPAVFVTMAKDKWYPAQHSYKYIAELQHTVGLAPLQTNPLMLRVGEDNHPQNPDRIANLIDKEADVFGFLLRALGLKLQ